MAFLIHCGSRHRGRSPQRLHGSAGAQSGQRQDGSRRAGQHTGPCGDGVLTGDTRCGAAAFESFHLLTHAVTTERVIATRCSGSAQLVRAAALAGGPAGQLTGCHPVFGLFALLCHRLFDTGIAYSDTSRGWLLSPRCRTGLPLPASTQSCCREMGCSGCRDDVSPSVPQHGGACDELG